MKSDKISDKTYYRLYGNNKSTGYELIDKSNDKDKIFKEAESLSGKEYYSCMIIDNDGNGDEIIYRKDFTKECTVEFSDNVKPKIEVKTIVFKPSRMKKKEELRKLTQEYVER